MQLVSGTVVISNIGGVGGGAAGGADFWGVVATGSDLIGRVVFSEGDANAVFPDSNIGFDTFRFVPAVQSVPEPSALTLLSSGIVGLALYAWRRWPAGR